MVILDDGALIGRYRVRSLMSRASLFDVYSTTDDRGIATCVLRSEHGGRSIPSDSEFNADLEKLRALRADLFPRVLDGGRDNRSAWIVTEAIGGTAPIWTPGADPVHWLRALLTLGRATAASFGTAAEAGIHHGLITPDCLRKWPNGAACVVGLGAARLFGLDIDTLRAAPRYCAPEQFTIAPIPVGDRLDVYSLALCLHALITGHEPFEGAAGSELMSLAQYGCPDLSLLQGTPDKVRELLARCCAKSASGRYSWREFEEWVGITVNLCQNEVPKALLMEIVTEKINQLDSDTLRKLAKRCAQDSDSDSDEDPDSGSDKGFESTEEPASSDPGSDDTDRTPPAGTVVGPLVVPIAAPLLIASAPSNEARAPTTDRVPTPQASPPSETRAAEAPDAQPPPLATPAVLPRKERKGRARALGALAMLAGICIALAVVIVSNNLPPVASDPPLTETQTACEPSGGHAKKVEPIAGPTVALADVADKQPQGDRPRPAKGAPPISPPAPTLPRRADRDLLKGSCGTWFECEPISMEAR